MPGIVNVIKNMKIQNTQFRIPTKKEFENLGKHFSRWNEEKKSFEVLNDSLSILELPATYYLDDEDDPCGFVDIGYYWSSTTAEGLSNGVYGVTLSPNNKFIETFSRDCECKVRLVSDEPFEGCIEFDGIYWKTTNEAGYFTFYDAMILFNNK